MGDQGWMDVEVKGLKELEQALKRLPDDIAQKALAQAVLAGAAVVRDEARSLCPRKSGRLAKSISARKKRNPGPNSTVVYQVGPKLFTGHMLEFGTAPHLIRAVKGKKLMVGKSGRNRWHNVYANVVKHPGAAARPFLRPAFDNSTGRVVDAMRKRLAAAIERGEIKFWRQQMGFM